MAARYRAPAFRRDFPIAPQRRSVVLDAGGGQYRVMALPGGTERGESLVICHRGELNSIDIRNLERSTVALSIAKLWSEKRETDQLIASSTLLRHLILVDPPDSSTVGAIRGRLKINAEQSVNLALIAIAGLDRAAQTNMIRAAAANTEFARRSHRRRLLGGGLREVDPCFSPNPYSPAKRLGDRRHGLGFVRRPHSGRGSLWPDGVRRFACCAK